MIYKMTLKDSVDEMLFNLLETPIVDRDIEGAVDNITLDGNQYTDYLYLKKQYIQKWAVMCPDEYDQLRGFYTRQFEEGTTPSYRVYYGSNIERDYTFNGDFIQFNAKGFETSMSLTQIKGNAEQTTYSGKNLFDRANAITNAGLAWATGANFSESKSISSGATSYITASTGTTLSSNFRMCVFCYDSDKTYLGAIQSNGTSIGTLAGGNFETITLPAGYSIAFVRLSFRTGLNNNVDMTAQDIMVNIGTLSPYEPYVGGTASPNPDYPQAIDVVTGEQTVGVTGKNLFSGNFSQFNNQGGTGAIYSYFKLPTNGTYTLSLKAKNDVPTQSVQVFLGFSFRGGDSTGGVKWAWTNGSSASKGDIVETTNEYNGVNFGYISMYVNNAQTLEWFVNNFEIQLELGDQASPYEPYVATNQEINLGKNLADLSTFSLGYINASGGIQNAHPQGEYHSPFIKVNPNTAYTFKIFETTGTNDSWFGVGEYTSESTSSFVRRDTNTVTTADSISFVTSATTNYVMVSARNLEQATKVQLEKGLTSTSWAEYFTPIELAKVGTYQDRIYKDSDDKWYVEKQVRKVVLDGSNDESINVGTITSLRYPFSYFADGKKYTNLSIDGLMCDTFYASTSSETATEFQNAFTFRGTSYNTVLWFFCPTSEISGSTAVEIVASFRTFLASHPTTVYYALATPTTTEITDDTLLEQLEHIYQLYGGLNNISIVGAGNGEIEVFIRDVIDAETDVVPEVPVRLTLTDEGIINACGCRRNVQLTMRETIEE